MSRSNIDGGRETKRARLEGESIDDDDTMDLTSMECYNDQNDQSNDKRKKVTNIFYLSSEEEEEDDESEKKRNLFYLSSEEEEVNILDMSDMESSDEEEEINVEDLEPLVEYDLRGTHRVIVLDTSKRNSREIFVSDRLIKRLRSNILALGDAKVQFGINTEYEKEGEFKSARISNRAARFSEDFLENGISALLEKIAIRSERGSSWKLTRILEVNFKVTKVSKISRLSGRRFIPTPQSLGRVNSIVNVDNVDDFCFLYSILAILKSEVVTLNRSRVTNYTPYLPELNYEGMVFPMTLANIPKFESKNPGLAINILSYTEMYTKDINFSEDEDVMKHPNIDIIHRSNVQDGRPIYLLLLTNSKTYHYVAVLDIDRLLNVRNEFVCNQRIRSRWCTRCLNGFRSQNALERHSALCAKHQLGTTLYTLPESKDLIFKDWSKTITPPFVIYADFEAILPKYGVNDQIHLPVSAGLLLINNLTGEMDYREYLGENCIADFLGSIDQIVKTIVDPFYENSCKKDIIPLTYLENATFRRARNCYLCNKEGKRFVKDHDHQTGQFLGACCNNCNLSRKIRKFLPVVFHNLRGYDMHHILKHGINKFPQWNISCIPTSTEKFISLFGTIIGWKVKFMDSCQFLNDSLAHAAKTITNFPITDTGFANGSIVHSKGLFPYHLATSMEALIEMKEMPRVWEGVEEEEYERAKSIWIEYGCTNLLQYMLLYMKLDVFLLADIFQQFRAKSIAHNQLEPLNFFGIPGMSWASALMTLKEPIELLTQMEMYNFYEGGIRGGMTFINKHYVKKNDKVDLLYIDINNLYGWALSQKLPYKNFEWVTDDLELERIMSECRSNLDLESLDYGYTMEVDIVIPDYLHDKLDHLPVAPENLAPPGSKVKKLLLTHEPKLNYVIHWRLLQYYLSIGVKVSKVHRAIKFGQASIFKIYVDTNTELRAKATNDLDKNFYKLLNNSLYGKTVENLKKRMDLRLCTTASKMVVYASKPKFRRSIKIADDLIAVLLSKEVVCLDRPTYIGQTVLDLSKLRMYQLQYTDLEKYREQFHCEINIVAGDTDSFFLECVDVDLKTELLPAMISDGLLDTSNYSKKDPLYSNALNAVVGKFKDESKGLVNYKEWIFLRPKCYSLLSEESETMKAKGINLSGSLISHNSYRKVYNDGEPISINQRRFGTDNHQLFTYNRMKVALTNTEDKRYWLDKNESVAYGHYLHRLALGLEEI